MALADTTAEKANRRFIRRAMKAPLLDSQREIALATAWRVHHDERALHQLTEAYMRLVIAMAARFRAYGLPRGDLIQEGMVGLMQAAARFEPEREVRFSTYAAWWIRAAIQDYVLRNWSIVRTGTTAAQKALFFNLRRLRAMIDNPGASRISPEARAFVARKLRVDESDVDAMDARLAAADRSLNAPVGEEAESEWQDLLPEDREREPEQLVMLAHDAEIRSKWINLALDTLSPRELTIIKERRLQDESVTLESLGARLGISKERVRQIEHQALTKLKQALIAIAGDPRESGLAEF